MSEDVDTGPASMEPEFSVDTETGEVTLSWPGGVPDAVLMTPESLEAIVAERNGLTKRLRALETIVTIWRLGRRPSKADWEAAQVTPISQEARIDLMRRKSRVDG